MAILRDRASLLTEDNQIANISYLSSCIREFRNKQQRRIKTLQTMYNAPLSHEIKVNHAKEITDLITAYIFGLPLSYNNGNMEWLIDWFTETDEDSHNYELGKSASIAGCAYELIYLDTIGDTSTVMPYLAELDPLHTFIVRDTDIRNKIIMGVYYIENYDNEGNLSGYTVTAYTDSYIYVLKGRDLDSLAIESTEQHYFGEVPINPLTNNKEEKGDFEDCIGLIEAYDDLQANRCKDKQQFIDRLLVVFNSSLGDSQEELEKNKAILKDGGILELNSSDGATSDAKFISQTFSESEVEVLKKSISNDIHKIAKIPDMTDENFSGSSSGIAIRYKLFGTEELACAKERQFKKAIRRRLRLINNAMGVKGYNIDLSAISLMTTRNLPISLDEKLQELQGTEGILSLHTRIQRYDEELNVEEEIKTLMEEKREMATIMSQSYDNYNYNNTNTDKETDSSSNTDEEVEEQE